jgi:predicted PurR-regulated permease PerM
VDLVGDWRNVNNRPWYIVIDALLGVLALIFLACMFLYYVRAVLPPFVIAFGIAFLLDPLIGRLQRRGCPRILAVTSVFAVFMAAFVVSIIFLLPVVIQQARELGDHYAHYADTFASMMSGFLDRNHAVLVRLDLPTSLQDMFSEYGTQANNLLKQEVPTVGKWIIDRLPMLPWIILIPLICFYFLNDFARIRFKALLFVPEKYRKETADLLARMGHVFSAYVRGLTIVCLLYALAVTIVLTVLGLQYGIILGILGGILYAVPYLGSITMAVLVFLVGAATFTNPSAGHALLTTACVIGTNQIFDFFITPRILGKSVGLHPILSLFALLAGGKLFGLPGMILAVPIAASMQEIIFVLYPELSVSLSADDPKPSLLSRIAVRRKKV